MVRSPEHRITQELPAPATSLVLAAEVAKIVQQAERAHRNFLTEWVLKPGIKNTIDLQTEELLGQMDQLEQELTGQVTLESLIALNRLLSDLDSLYTHETQAIRHTTNVDRLYEAVSSTLVKQLEVIAQITVDSDPEMQKRAFSLLDQVLNVERIRMAEALPTERDTDSTKAIVGALQQRMPQYADSINRIVDTAVWPTIELPPYMRLFRLAMRHLPAKDRALLDEPMARSFFRLDDSGLAYDLGNQLGSEGASYAPATAADTQPTEQAEHKTIEAILRQCGYSIEESYHLIQCWFAAAPLDQQGELMTNQLNAVRALETAKPGICKQLSQDFGIRCFARYPLDLLLKQVEERDEPGAYGVYATAIMDHNGAHRNQGENLEKIINQIPGGRLRIIEVGSKVELLKRLTRLKVRHNLPVQFLFINAHANAEGLAFGRKRWANAALETSDITSQAAQSVDKLIDAHGQIIIIGCEAGQKGGIAERASQEFKRPVLASPFITRGVKKITARYDTATNNYTFDLRFNSSRKLQGRSSTSQATQYNPS